MSGSRPESVIDPVCGMTVNVATAEAAGLTIEHDGRTYAFCRAGCRRAFEEEPVTYVRNAEAGQGRATEPDQAGTPEIDEGMRRWYESCSCCLSEAYPEIKAALDRERADTREAPVDAGICEVAEAGADAETQEAAIP